MNTPKPKVEAPPSADEVRAKERELTALQEGATKMLDRIAAEKAAKGDEPSGIVVGTDYDFIRSDPSDPAPYLAEKGVPPRKDHAYGWLNTDSRVIGNRMAKGWKPVEGGIKRGDLILASRPQELQDRETQQGLQRVKLMEQGPMRTFDADARKEGVETFTGNKSLKDGL